ncbi:hypothetical protein OWR29_37270 [Actinoplanes sp. Pm04-4]|uniref:Uncharacterized protein n=1 Tax=Paractinoplanes pyxinae TaxID=2997416 RepID=A0ABT4BB46_9ACTN|nr:hypothetical protein [Actinoplanes pyxinae]MCY1143686.1 hypothetical protein [Actinoplanes pyxinae]
MTTVPQQVLGAWALTISTPIGKMAVTLDLTEQDGVLTGTAQDRHATVPLLGITTEPGPQASSTRLTWQQAIVKPMRLNLQFDVVVAGDTMAGFSRAGRLPRSAVHGERRAAS